MLLSHPDQRTQEPSDLGLSPVQNLDGIESDLQPASDGRGGLDLQPASVSIDTFHHVTLTPRSKNSGAQ